MFSVENPSLEPKPKRQKTEPKINSFSSLSSSSNTCVHWCVRHGVCSSCKSTVDKSIVQSFNYLLDGLRISHEAVTLTKRITTRLTCLYAKKLHLVLDLDQTLVHSARASRLSEAEKYLIEEAGSNKRDDLSKLHTGTKLMLVKLRPFVHGFLKVADEMFTMFVYTKGNSKYAKFVLEMIDPKRIYFGNRVITKEEGPPYMKTLDLVLADDRSVVIVDDTRDVWIDHTSNLVEISKYKYFRMPGQASKPSYSEEKTDESENEGGLADVLKILKAVHCEFFKDEEAEVLESKDVRLLLQETVIV